MNPKEKAEFSTKFALVDPLKQTHITKNQMKGMSKAR